MYTPSENAANGLIAGVSGIPAYMFAYIERTDIAFIASIGLPITLFIIGKVVDVLVRVYLAKREK